jgi:hypothetical protein
MEGLLQSSNQPEQYDILNNIAMTSVALEFDLHCLVTAARVFSARIRPNEQLEPVRMINIKLEQCFEVLEQANDDDDFECSVFKGSVQTTSSY